MPTEPDLLDEQNPFSDADETPPPAADRVARRLLALMAVAARGLIEPYSDQQDSDVARLDILSWLDQLEIWNEFEPDELELLHAPVGTLDPPADIDAAWKVEAVAVLAWALGLYTLSDYDQPVHVGELQEVVRFLDFSAAEIITSAKLRPVEELDTFGDQMFALHWRLNYFYMVDRNRLDFVKVAKNSRFGELNIEAARIIDGDLAVREVSITAAHDDERHICNGIVTERHRAANWLAGYDEIYSRVDVST